jgi:hypothetical protein
VQHRLIIAEGDKRLMEQWRESFLGFVLAEREFYAPQREERRVDRCRCRDFIYNEMTSHRHVDDNDPRWDDMWTTTTSNDH